MSERNDATGEPAQSPESGVAPESASRRRFVGRAAKLAGPAMVTLYSGSARAFESISCFRKLKDSYEGGSIHPKKVLRSHDASDNWHRKNLQTKTICKWNSDHSLVVDYHVFYRDDDYVDPYHGTRWFKVDTGSPTANIWWQGQSRDKTFEQLESLCQQYPNRWEVFLGDFESNGGGTYALAHIDDNGYVRGHGHNDNGGAPISGSCMVSFPIVQA